MDHPIISLFRPVLEAENTKAAINYLLAHPVLLSPYYTELLEGWVSALPSLQQARLANVMAERPRVFSQLRSGHIVASVPPSVLDLARKVLEGRYTLEYAQQVASQQAFFVEMMYPVVSQTCDVAEELLIRDWRPSVKIMRILLACLAARGEAIAENQQGMEVVAAECWVRVASVACTDVPDGRIFHDAVKRGEAVGDLQATSTPPYNTLHRLGVLHLDPYVAGRSPNNFTQQLRDWQQRLYEEYGDQLAGVAEDELKMPPVRDALPKAANYFRSAAQKRSGEARGRSLKALAQTLRWYEYIDLPQERDECIEAAREALSLLPREQYPAEHAELSRFIEELGQASEHVSSETLSAARALLEKPVEQLIKDRGEWSVLNIFNATADSLGRLDSLLALRLLMAIDDLVRSQAESKRRVHDERLLQVAIRAYAPNAPKAIGQSLNNELQDMFKLAEREGWSQQRIQYSVLSLAASSAGTCQEEEGLQVLAYCSGLIDRGESDPVLIRTVTFLKASLQVGAAVNVYDGKRYGEAARLYVDAFRGCLVALQPLAALDILRRLLDLAKPGNPHADEALEAMIVGLAKNSIVLEILAGEAGIDLVQRAARQAVAVLMTGGAESTLLYLVLDFAKGRMLRSLLASAGVMRNWLKEPRTTKAEAEILTLESQVGITSSGGPPALDQNTLITSYVGASEMKGGGTPATELRNLQIQFDTQLMHALSISDKNEWSPSTELLRSLIDDRTVLLVQFLGSDLQGQAILMTLLISKETEFATYGTYSILGSATVILGSGEEKTRASMLSFRVRDLRECLCRPPGPRAADSRALDELLRDSNLYTGGPIGPKLQELRASGKDHICISPHGPLHYYPFHLMGPEDDPLSQEWCVTYLPHLRLLDREEGGYHPIELTAIGINFAEGNPFGLGVLGESEDEARAIANVYGDQSRLLIGPDATKNAALEALAESRRVHISTHGMHNASAPSFQCIFVNPSANDNGILHAYEMQRLDLRGLELVTLSACETALGRIDIADNLRGIPAALLIAGVRTIIGTLWNVETETATYFFRRFYSNLKEARSTRTAFRKAQADTRCMFPKYRDWGAFQLIGASS